MNNQDNAGGSGKPDLTYYKRYIEAAAKADSLALELEAKESRINEYKTYWEKGKLSEKDARDKYKDIMTSGCWRKTAFLRKFEDGRKSKKFRKMSMSEWRQVKGEDIFDKKPVLYDKDAELTDDQYKEFCSLLPGKSIMFYNEAISLDGIKRQTADGKNGPGIGIAVPLFNTPLLFLEELLDSVLAQTYQNWNLYLGDASDAAHANVKVMAEQYAARDKRIHYFSILPNEGISANTNKILRNMNDEYICLVDHDDLLHPCALYCTAQELKNGADMTYSDELTFFEDDIKAISERALKPDFNWDYFRSNNYMCHLTTFSHKLMNEAGMENSAYDGAQDYDLYLRLAEKAKKIRHIPHILYYWRSHANSTANDINAKPYSITAGENALREHYQRMGIEAQVESIDSGARYKTSYKIHGEPMVSIIIPNKDQIPTLYRCVKSILKRSIWKNYEVIIVDNNSTEKDTPYGYEIIKDLDSRIRTVHYEGEFNYSKINNFGMQQAKGDYFLFLNNDVEVILPGWIKEMLMLAQQDRVGAVGCMLYYPNGDIQHGGVVVNRKSIFHLGYGLDGKIKNYNYELVREDTANTGACLMVKREKAEALNGFDTGLAQELNDVDFCLRLRKTGYSNLYTPFAKLVHYESISRGHNNFNFLKSGWADDIYFFNKWNDEMTEPDPFFNLNYQKDSPIFNVRLNRIC